jgi:hypothetical protein
MESASCSEEGIFFKASCAASFSWKYSHSLRNTQALNKKKHDESTYKQTWRALTRSHRGGKSVKTLLTVSSGGFAFLKKECLSNFSAVGLFV